MLNSKSSKFYFSRVKKIKTKIYIIYTYTHNVIIYVCVCIYIYIIYIIRLVLEGILKTFLRQKKTHSKWRAAHPMRSRKLVDCTKYRPNKTKIIISFEFKI